MPAWSVLADASGKLLRAANFNLLIPFIPGGILVLGELFISEEAVKALLGFPKVFGDATPAVLLLFGIYTSGVLLIYAVNAFIEGIGWTIGNFIGGRLASKTTASEPAMNEAWRNTAATFLGNELAPRRPDSQIDQLNSWTETWRQWSLVIEQYFPSGLYDLPRPKHDFSSCVQSCGWAGIFLLSLGLKVHWFIWTVCIIAALAGFVSEIFVGMARAAVGSEPFQVAAMLRELKSRRPRETDADGA